MFKWLFKYWYNPTDTTTINSKLNLWAFINIRLFKNKLSIYIYYFILNLKNLKLKKIKIFYNNLCFSILYNSSIILILILILIIIFIINLI